MTFLLPWALVVLPLVALPLDIHLVNRRRFQTVERAATTFMRSARALSRGDSLVQKIWRAFFIAVLPALNGTCLLGPPARPAGFPPPVEAAA